MQPDGSKPLTPWIGYLMLAGVVFGWSSGVVWVRGVHEVIPPLGMSFWRWFIGALMVLPFARASLKKDGALIREHLVFYFMMGGLIVGGSTLSTVSLNFTTATNVGIVNATQPMMTVLVAWAFFKDKLNAWQWAGIFVAFAGILAMVSKADLAVFLDLSFNVGDFIMIGAVVMFAYYANNLPRLPSSVITMIVVLAPLLSYLFALPVRLERFRWLGIAGLLISEIPHRELVIHHKGRTLCTADLHLGRMSVFGITGS